METKVTDSYGNLPLSFEANEGQFDSRVKFISRAGSHMLFLTSTEAVLKMGCSRQAARAEPAAASTVDDPQQSATVESNVGALRMKMAGANTTAKVTGLDELPGKSNYFIGNDPAKWRVNVRNYAKVKYEAVYRGVDLLYYGNHGRLEYDLIVAPGADPSIVELAFEGADTVSVDATGDLVIGTPAGYVRHGKPVAHQNIDDQEKDVNARYVMKGPHQVGFEIAPYDSTNALVIDPVLKYSTYLGGSRLDQGYAISVDSAGDTYVVGRTVSSDFPITPNAIQATNGDTGSGLGDVFIAKLNPAGNAVIYSTYLGGPDEDTGLGVALNAAGEAFITGYTRSTNFPTTPGSFQPAHSGNTCPNFGQPCTEAFVTKLNATGTGLIYSTYLSGPGAAEANGIAIDSQGNAYLTGTAYSPDFPTTPGAFQTVFGGGSDDAFVTKLNAAGSALVYSTYLGGARGVGGNGEDFGFGIQVDSSGNAYVAGTTESGNFPTTSGAFNPIGDSGDTFNAFVTKLNPTGSALLYSTYLGGGVTDIARAIAIDIEGNAYVTGETDSGNFPTTPGAFRVTAAGFDDAFVTKLNTTGSALVYSTFLGGSTNDDSGYAIAVDSSGNAYLTGQTGAINFPTTPDAFQLSYGLNGDAFVTKLNASGTALLYSSFLGGGEFDFGAGIAVDSSHNVFLVGATYSGNFPATPGAFQVTKSGDSDCFVVKISETVAYDICLQDESNGFLLRINSTTGEYVFTTCLGITLTGTGVIIRRGCLTTLQVNGPDRRLLASIDTCRNAGTVSMQVFSQGRTFTIQDRNTANNTCVCSGK